MTSWINLLFRPGELICSGNKYATVLTPMGDTPPGPYIAINPLTGSRADINVTAHRNFLVEIDDGRTLEEQERAVRALGLPVSAITYSGGKSLHFIVALEEPVEPKLWRRQAKALINLVEGADTSTCNPSRFTRLPGVVRPDTGLVQDLLYIGHRIPNEEFASFIGPHTPPETPNFRRLYAELHSLKGLEAAHPLTAAFIAGTHPCTHGRNNALYKCAADLRDVGMNADEAHSLLAGPAFALGLTEKEVANTVGSAYTKSRR